MRDRAAQIQEARPELEPLLLADLEQAGCTREQVAAHMALGTYYQRRGLENKAQEHLSFVVARGGRLAVRTGGGADAVPPIRKGLRQAGDNVLPVRLGFLPFG